MAALLAEFNGYLDVDDADPAAESRPSWRARPYPIPDQPDPVPDEETVLRTGAG